MSGITRWLTATTDALARLRDSRRHPGEVPLPREPEQPTLSLGERLAAPDHETRLTALREWVDFGSASRAHQQPALDILCRSLRALPWPGTETDQRWRLVLQASLTAHLLPGPGFWHDADVDLSQTTLVDLDLTQCRARRLNLSGTRLLGDAHFEEATFLGDVDLSGSFFARHVFLARSVFGRRLVARGATFSGDANLVDVHVAGDSSFERARFSARADFSAARFGADADFNGVRFSGRAVFREAAFAGASSFVATWFRGGENFVGASFGGDSSFSDAHFHA